MSAKKQITLANGCLNLNEWFDLVICKQAHARPYASCNIVNIGKEQDWPKYTTLGNTRGDHRPRIKVPTE